MAPVAGGNPRRGVVVASESQGQDSPLVRTGPRGLVGSWQRSRQRIFVAFLIPSLAILAAVTVLPLAFLIVTSFTPFDLTKPGSFHFVGLSTYEQALADPRFRNSVWVQARLSFWTVTLQVAAGLGLALLLNTKLRFIQVLRSVFMIPMVLPPVVAAIIWKILFTPNVSILYWILEQIGLRQPPWLDDPVLALWALIASDTWEWLPFAFIILLTALQMMPQEPLEAAGIDGASGRQTFVYVVLPLLRPAILVTVLLRFVESVKAFPHIYVMTGGGPGTVTQATNYYGYLHAFSYSEIGFSSAVVVLMVLAVFVASVPLIHLLGRNLDVE